MSHPLLTEVNKTLLCSRNKDGLWQLAKISDSNELVTQNYTDMIIELL